MELIPLFAALAIGIVGLALMLAAFFLIAKQGGWQQAMEADVPGHWTTPRRLMVGGATLGLLFGVSICVLYLIPGGIPWLTP